MLEIAISLIPAVARKFTRGRHAGRDFESKRLTIFG